MYWWTTVCLIGVAFLYWLDCYHPGGSTHGSIYLFLAAVVNSGWQPHGPAGQAMIVDMMHSSRLGSCLPIMQVVSQLGPWLGNIMLVAVVAMGLTDYTPVWTSLTLLGCGVLVFMWWGIFETLPPDSRKPFEPMKWLREYFLCFMLLKTDFVLMKVWFVIFFMWMANGGWMSTIYSCGCICLLRFLVASAFLTLCIICATMIVDCRSNWFSWLHASHCIAAQHLLSYQPCWCVYAAASDTIHCLTGCAVNVPAL